MPLRCRETRPGDFDRVDEARPEHETYEVATSVVDRSNNMSATINAHMEICEDAVGALQGLSSVLTVALFHLNTDWCGKGVADGLSLLFRHELDSIDNALAVIRDELRVGRTAADSEDLSAFNAEFDETVVPANRMAGSNA